MLKQPSPVYPRREHGQGLGFAGLLVQGAITVSIIWRWAAERFPPLTVTRTRSLGTGGENLG